MAGGRATGSGLSGTSPSTGGRALIIFIVLSISLFTASVRGGETGVLGTIRSGFSTVTTPFRLVGSAITAPFYGLGNIFSNLTADQATLSELQEENERLVQRNIELEEKAQLADRLAALMEIQSTYNLLDRFVVLDDHHRQGVGRRPLGRHARHGRFGRHRADHIRLSHELGRPPHLR